MAGWRPAAFLGGAALALAAGSAAIQSHTTDRVIVGSEGTVEENAVPRLSGGWPAPFVADVGGISVPDQLGLEDEFRPWPFVADAAFWLLVLIALRRAMARFTGTARRR